MRLLLLFTFLPFFCFSQSHIFSYYDSVPVLSDGNALKLPWAGGINSAQLNMADLDGDLQDEIIILDRHATAISIFSYSGGEYVYRPDLLEYLPALNKDWIIFADYNCDGRQDIFNYGQNGVIVYKNVSQAGEFAAWEKVADPLLTTGFSGKINMFINPADVPAIQDVDGDGDLDVLCYNFATGEDIRFHKNLALEKHGDCEIFDFEITDRQWGEFKECSCFEYAFFGDNCPGVNGGRVAHIGGKSLTASDQDNDGDQDLFLGHDDCASLIFLENKGDADNALFTDFSPEYPLTEPAVIERYPTVQFHDINFDGKEEMVVSPNIDDNLAFAADFSKSVWIYKNGVNDTPDTEFTMVQKDFLQDEMMDMGSLSAPVFFDIDRDGDLDILIASNGKESSGLYVGKIVLLENTGTSFNPIFSLADEDFLNLSTWRLHAPRLRFADFDGDQQEDLFLAGYDATERQMKSLIIPAQPANGKQQPFTPEAAISVVTPLALFENPEFFDEDGDGDPDLLVGHRDGALTLYENTGNNTFELKENEYKGFHRDFTLQKINLFVEVTDLNGDGKPDLISADRKELAVYYNFQQADPQPEVLMTYYGNENSPGPVPTEHYNWLAFADLFGTGNKAMIVGGSGGGLKFYRNKNEIENPVAIEINIKVYPNPLPSTSNLVVETNKAGNAVVYNLWGQTISSSMNLQAGIKNIIDIPEIAQGVYLLVFETTDKEKLVRKLVVK